MSTPLPAPPQDSAKRSSFSRDLLSSFVVFLVAVPLCLGIALASNAPIMSGLIAGIIGGIVVGMIAGAPLQVSGPAAGLVVLVFGLTEQMGGDWQMVCAIIALAGVLQIAFAAMRIARFSLAVSPAVVHGMLAGIGVLIALGQVHVMLGGSPQSSALGNLRDLPSQLASPNWISLAFGLLTIAILVLWPRVKFARFPKIPAPLVGVVLASVISLAWGDDLQRISLTADDLIHAVSAGGELLPVAADAAAPRDQGHLLAAIALPRWPTHLSLFAILQAAFAVALIASVESLLCAVATDKLHTGEPANLDRELFAQGVGNTLSGLLGGLPITGVIVRSSANIESGAKTRWSAVMHGFWILIFIGLLPFMVELIPKTVLAAMLVLIGVRLVNIREAKHLYKHGELPIYLITILSVVFVNLLAGVAIGFACALLRLVWKLSRVSISVEEGDPLKVTITGALTFLGVPTLTKKLRTLPKASRVVIDLAVESLDHAGWTALQAWREGYESGGGSVELHSAEHLWTADDGTPGSKPSAPLSADTNAEDAPALAESCAS